MPGDFVLVAEETGLIAHIGEWVLREACDEAARWPKEVNVPVNLSSVQFRSGNLAQVVLGALVASSLAPGRLELEITETALLQESEATLATLQQLRTLGVRLSMDDFGTGYSSLSHIRFFSFDKIKIDSSFVRDLDRNTECAAIVCAVIELGRGLGIASTAEGVETKEQLSRLQAMGCTQAQGYLFGRPRPAHQVARLLARFGRPMEIAA